MIEKLEGLEFPTPKPKNEEEPAVHAARPTASIADPGAWDPKAGVTSNGGDAAWGMDSPPGDKQEKK